MSRISSPNTYVRQLIIIIGAIYFVVTHTFADTIGDLVLFLYEYFFSRDLLIIGYRYVIPKRSIDMEAVN